MSTTDDVVQIMAESTSYFIQPEYAREALAALDAAGYSITRTPVHALNTATDNELGLVTAAVLLRQAELDGYPNDGIILPHRASEVREMTDRVIAERERAGR